MRARDGTTGDMMRLIGAREIEDRSIKYSTSDSDQVQLLGDYGDYFESII